MYVDRLVTEAKLLPFSSLGFVSVTVTPVGHWCQGTASYWWAPRYCAGAALAPVEALLGGKCEVS